MILKKCRVTIHTIFILFNMEYRKLSFIVHVKLMRCRAASLHSVKSIGVTPQISINAKQLCILISRRCTRARTDLHNHSFSWQQGLCADRRLFIYYTSGGQARLTLKWELPFLQSFCWNRRVDMHQNEIQVGEKILKGLRNSIG